MLLLVDSKEKFPRKSNLVLKSLIKRMFMSFLSGLRMPLNYKYRNKSFTASIRGDSLILYSFLLIKKKKRGKRKIVAQMSLH